MEEAPAEAVVDDAPAAEATVVETGEPLVEADVQEPVVEAEVVEETN